MAMSFVSVVRGAAGPWPLPLPLTNYGTKDAFQTDPAIFAFAFNAAVKGLEFKRLIDFIHSSGVLDRFGALASLRACLCQSGPEARKNAEHAETLTAKQRARGLIRLQDVENKAVSSKGLALKIFYL